MRKIITTTWVTLDSFKVHLKLVNTEARPSGSWYSHTNQNSITTAHLERAHLEGEGFY